MNLLSTNVSDKIKIQRATIAEGNLGYLDLSVFSDTKYTISNQNWPAKTLS